MQGLFQCFPRGSRSVSFPLQIGGEWPGQRLIIKSYVNTPVLKFRLMINFPPVVCRVDFDSHEQHPNLRRRSGDGVPPIVRGAHYHSWILNRRFAKASQRLFALPIAAEVDVRLKTFGDTLKWFCDDVNIEPPPDGVIELPDQEFLI
jgi:hypothetical protein